MPEKIENIDARLLQLLTAEQAQYFKIIPRSESAEFIEFYTSTVEYNNIKEELEILLAKEVLFKVINEDTLEKYLSIYYRVSNNKNKEVSLTHSEDFLIKLIKESHQLGSSDIHVEAYDENCRIRYRIDGKLIEKYILNKDEYPVFINKIKIKANLDIAEKRLPQDGRIFFEENTLKFDIRVSILPTLYGEKIVLRLLSKDTSKIDINSLGFTDIQIKNYLEAIKKPHGIILISGPTGSGKTTTLYATLKILNSEQVNILTIEDPIEYTLDGINQVQLKESIGLTFSSALRTFLRQDPDIIMLGEIRDNETAQMAVRAALTGHLVLSTIHTNSAWGTVSRLIDMDVPPFLIANTLNLSVAQRLVRLLCPKCKEEQKLKRIDIFANYPDIEQPQVVYTAKGCNSCYYTGYKGRTAIYEVILIDNVLADKIKFGEDAVEYLNNKGIKSLAYNALELYSKGLTTLDEIYSIIIANN